MVASVTTIKEQIYHFLIMTKCTPLNWTLATSCQFKRGLLMAEKKMQESERNMYTAAIYIVADYLSFGESVP